MGAHVRYVPPKCTAVRHVSAIRTRWAIRQIRQMNRPPRQFTIRHLLALTFATGACCAIGAFAYRLVFYFPPPGPVEPHDAIARQSELQRLFDAAARNEIELNNLEVFRVYDSGWDAEYYLRIDSSPELLTLVRRWQELEPLSDSDPRIKQFWSTFPVAWNDGMQSDELEFFGEFTSLMHDKSNQRLVIHFIHDF